MAKKKDEVKLPRSGVENYSCGRGASCRGVGVVKARDCIWVKDVTSRASSRPTSRATSSRSSL